MIAGSDRPVAIEPVPLGRAQRGHDQGILRRNSRRHCLAHHPVDVAVVCDVARGRGRRCRTRSGRGRTRARAAAEPGGCVPSTPRGSAATFRRGAARGPPRPSAPRDPSGSRRPRTPAAPSRRSPGAWPSTWAAPCSSSFAAPRRPLTTAGEVHHLGEPEDAPAPHQRLEIAGPERAARRLEGRGRDARRRHEEDVELQVCRGIEQPVDAVDAEHVRDLVRVGDDGRRPEREHEARELVDEELRPTRGACARR